MNSTYNRTDKIEWLKETCSNEFLRDHLLHEVGNWMGEREFEKFYDHLCRNWDIRRDPNDPEFDPERDSME